MITIRTKYTKRTLCYYCGENEAVRGEEALVFFYKVLNVRNNDCTSEIVHLYVPRCKECSSKQAKANWTIGRYFLFYFLILIPFCFFYLNYNGFDSWAEIKADFFGALAGVLAGVFVVAFFGAFLLMWLMGKIVEFIRGGKRKSYDNVNTYGPAIKLKECGFKQGIIDKKYEIALFKEFDKEAFREKLSQTLQKIAEEDNCSINGRS